MNPDRLDALKMASLTQIKNIQHPGAVYPSFLPIHLTGGIGDVIMSVDAIKLLAKEYYLAVYTPHIEALKYFYPEVLAFDGLPNFAWRIDFNTLAKFEFSDGFSRFLNEDHEGLFLKQRAAFINEPRLQSLTKLFPTKFFMIADYAKEINVDRRMFPLRCLGYKANIPIEAMSFRKSNYITIHDGFDKNSYSLVEGRSTKQWSVRHWNDLVYFLKQSYPRHRIIQLGVSTTARVIDGVDECLIDKTTITQAFDLIRHASLHIDGDSGLVHAAARLQTPSVVLWGSTPMEFYGYKQNINIKSNVCSGGCYGVIDTWMKDCAVGWTYPRCMDEISPAMVMDRIKKEPWILTQDPSERTY